MCRFCEQAAFGPSVSYDPQLGRGGLAPGANLPADLILHGGPILTMDPLRPVVGAIAIREGVIQHVGAADKLIPARGRMTRVTDLEGRAVMPGLIATGQHLPPDRDVLSLDLWISGLVRQGITTVELLDLGADWADHDRLAELLLRRHRLRLRGGIGPALRADWQGEPLAPGMGPELIRYDTMRLSLSSVAGSGVEAALTEAARLHSAGWAVVLDDITSGSGMDPHALACQADRVGEGIRLASRITTDTSFDTAIQPLDKEISVSGRPCARSLSADRLAALTVHAARRAGVGDICGMLRPGFYADFAILEKSPGAGTVPEVLGTWIEGVPVRQETDHVAL